jgi:hypothetical protein
MAHSNGYSLNIKLVKQENIRISGFLRVFLFGFDCQSFGGRQKPMVKTLYQQELQLFERFCVVVKSSSKKNKNFLSA